MNGNEITPMTHRALAPSAYVMTSKEVAQDRDDDPDPDHPGEEDDDRPDDLEEGIVVVSGEKHSGLHSLQGCLTTLQAGQSGRFCGSVSSTCDYVGAMSATEPETPSQPPTAGNALIGAAGLGARVMASATLGATAAATRGDTARRRQPCGAA